MNRYRFFANATQSKNKNLCMSRFICFLRTINAVSLNMAKYTIKVQCAVCARYHHLFPFYANEQHFAMRRRIGFEIIKLITQWILKLFCSANERVHQLRLKRKKNYYCEKEWWASHREQPKKINENRNQMDCSNSHVFQFGARIARKMIN